MSVETEPKLYSRQQALDEYRQSDSLIPGDQPPTRWTIRDDFARDKLHARLAYIESDLNVEAGNEFDRAVTFLSACVVHKFLLTGEISEPIAVDTVLDSLQAHLETDQLWFEDVPGVDHAEAIEYLVTQAADLRHIPLATRIEVIA